MRYRLLIIPTLFAAFLMGLGVGMSSRKCEEGREMKELHANHRISESKQALGGTTTGQGLSINWRGADTPSGADPIDVVSAAADRLRHLQTTTAGGNDTAKALWSVEKCLDDLKSIYDKSNSAPGLGSAAGFGGTQETESK